MEKVKAFVVHSEAHDGYIIANTIVEVGHAIDAMHSGESPEDLGEDFSVSVSVKEFDKEEYDDLMSREWEG